MLGPIKKLLRRRAASPVFDAPIEIDRPTYAVGDIHGRHDLLIALLERIADDAARHGFEDARLVFLGDYVDRGEESAQVLATLGALARDGGDSVALLRGNHEQMLLDFIADPAAGGPRWLSNGGLQTLMSYGVGGLGPASDPQALTDAAARLAQAMGPDLDLLRLTPDSALFGRVLFAHAGADPALPPERQEARALLWGAPGFRRTPRADGLWVAHGHWVVDEPSAEQGRIALDTGAWFSGRLTAARIAQGEVAFLQT